MNVGDLFINIGITGADKTASALAGIGKGLDQTKTSSLEAKAAILAAMYATQQLFSQSGQAGTNLTNFSATIGVTTKTLQQYQYAARQVGVSNEETANTFKNLQSQMTKTLLGKGGPAGLARVADLTGGLSNKDIKTFADKPELLIQRLQEYAKREKNAGLRNETLKTFGISDNFGAALTRNAFTQPQLAKAPAYSDNEIAKLDRANIAWSNLGTKIEMAVGHFNALHGGQLVNDISMITDKVLLLAQAFISLADKIKFFEGIGKAFEGWAAIFDRLGTATNIVAKDGVSGLVKEAGSTVGELINGYIANKQSDNQQAALKAGLLSKVAGGLSGSPGDRVVGSAMGAKPGTQEKPIVTKPADSAGSNLRLLAPPSPIMPTKSAINPPVSPLQPTAKPGQNVEISQTLNFNHDAADAKKTGDSVKKAVQDAIRQRSSQLQVN